MAGAHSEWSQATGDKQLEERKNAATSQEAISAEQIARTGGGDAGQIATKITVPPITVACPGFSPKIHHTNKGPTTISSMVIIDTSGAGK